MSGGCASISGSTQVLLVPCVVLCFALLGDAASPDLKTPEPVIYLADNLDEKDNLGFCIDTVGRGFAEKLHAHSCKPKGGDVQFYYNAASRQIVSATYSGKCAILVAPAAPGTLLALLDCSSDSKELFDYSAETLEFSAGDDPSLCLVVGAASAAAGPFMSRSLELADCSSTEAKYKQWHIKDSRTSGSETTATSTVDTTSTLSPKLATSTTLVDSSVVGRTGGIGLGSRIAPALVLFVVVH